MKLDKNQDYNEDLMNFYWQNKDKSKYTNYTLVNFGPVTIPCFEGKRFVELMDENGDLLVVEI